MRLAEGKGAPGTKVHKEAMTFRVLPWLSGTSTSSPHTANRASKFWPDLPAPPTHGAGFPSECTPTSSGGYSIEPFRPSVGDA